MFFSKLTLADTSFIIFKGFGALDGTPCKVPTPVAGVNVKL